MRRALVLLPTLLAAAACATPTIPHTDLPDTADNRAIVDLVERYRAAMEARDAQTLRSLASRSYYENGASTWTSSDDWGHPDLDDVLSRYEEHVKAVTYDIQIREVRVYGNRADVDYDHTWAFQFSDGKRDAWTRKADVNRLELIQEDGGWRILSGM